MWYNPVIYEQFSSLNKIRNSLKKKLWREGLGGGGHNWCRFSHSRITGFYGLNGNEINRFTEQKRNHMISRIGWLKSLKLTTRMDSVMATTYCLEHSLCVFCTLRWTGITQFVYSLTYGLHERGVRVWFLAGSTDISPLHSVQTGTKAHPASGALSPGVKRSGREADHQIPHTLPFPVTYVTSQELLYGSWINLILNV
jgi:hypothetical protein